ncbi:MAG: chemotaxis protein CheW [Alphaproteobacteria bacterium]
MSDQLALSDQTLKAEDSFIGYSEDNDLVQVLSLYVGKQLFGLPINRIRDVLPAQRITQVPLSDAAILGVMNLRGRVVTVIDLAQSMQHGSSERDPNAKGMNIVIEYYNELYSIFVDRVGNVIDLQPEHQEELPLTLESDIKWKKIAYGVYRMKDDIMVLLDADKLLALDD